jgi:large subunit ribosomal protein L4
MELKLLNAQGQADGTTSAPETLFGREYNEALVHQIVVAFQANARQGTRAQKDRRTVKHSTRKPWRQKGTGRARAGMTSSPIWRGGGRAFPNSPDENFTHKVNKKMYRAGMTSILSQLARDGRIAVVESMAVDSPKTKPLAQRLKAMGMDSVLIITDAIDENLYLASRNLKNVMVIEPRYADPLALVHYKNVVVTKPAIAKSQDRLYSVLLAPIVSEKSTMIGEKNEQVAFRVKHDATKPEVKAAVELLFKVQVESVQILNQKGKTKRFGRFEGRRGNVRKAYVSLKPGQEINFAQEVK